MAQSFTGDVRTGTQLTRNLMANAEARALADAATNLAINRLLVERTDADRAYDGTPYRTTIGGANVDISVQDESGKIDLNAAPAALLERLFRKAGLTDDDAQAVVDAIADWRDRDSLRRLHGAEGSDYHQAKRDYEPKNSAFDSIDELRLVLGISPTLFERIRPAITVYARRRGVDPRVATPAVLAAILDDEGQASDVLKARMEHLPGSAATALSGIPKSFTVRSPRNTFTIRATARTAAGATFTREAVIRIATRRGRVFTVLAWGRGASKRMSGMAQP